jgi:hypothetical protein
MPNLNKRAILTVNLSILLWLELYLDQFQSLVSCGSPPPLINRVLDSLDEYWMSASDLDRLNHPIGLHHGFRFHALSNS